MSFDRCSCGKRLVSKESKYWKVCGMCAHKKDVHRKRRMMAECVCGSKMVFTEGKWVCQRE